MAKPGYVSERRPIRDVVFQWGAGLGCLAISLGIGLGIVGLVSKAGESIDKSSKSQPTIVVPIPTVGRGLTWEQALSGCLEVAPGDTLFSLQQRTGLTFLDDGSVDGKPYYSFTEAPNVIYPGQEVCDEPGIGQVRGWSSPVHPGKSDRCGIVGTGEWIALVATRAGFDYSRGVFIDDVYKNPAPDHVISGQEVCGVK